MKNECLPIVLSTISLYSNQKHQDTLDQIHSLTLHTSSPLNLSICPTMSLFQAEFSILMATLQVKFLPSSCMGAYNSLLLVSLIWTFFTGDPTSPACKTYYSFTQDLTTSSSPHTPSYLPQSKRDPMAMAPKADHTALSCLVSTSDSFLPLVILEEQLFPQHTVISLSLLFFLLFGINSSNQLPFEFPLVLYTNPISTINIFFPTYYKQHFS